MSSLTQGTLTPAYNRDYKSAKSAIADFIAGKNFIFNSPTQHAYCSIRDCDAGDTVTIRYNNNRSVTTYTVPKNHLK